ncbi:MAG: CoA-binding protein [Chloroflexi bacterium]|nr:CoA-binding protein [Chloroflexota bacterium]
MDLREQLLNQCKTIAVVGISPRPDRDSHGVAKYLQEQGYRVIPVNPLVQEVLGETCYPSLTAVPEPVDMVDIFRRSELVLPVVQEAIQIGARAIWMQDGVVNQEAAALAEAAGLAVVMDD